VPDKSGSARIWPRTGCTGIDGADFHCETGDCGNKIKCRGATGQNNASLAEFTLNGYVPPNDPNAKPADSDFYDTSYLDGYNVTTVMKPKDGTFDTSGGTPNKWCGETGVCSGDAKNAFPEENKIYNADHTKVVAVKGICGDGGARCCKDVSKSGPACTPDSLLANDKANYDNVRAICQGYLYDYDDKASTHNCKGKDGKPSPDYDVFFCGEKDGGDGSGK